MARSASKSATVHMVDDKMDTADGETPVQMEASPTTPVANEQAASQKKSSLGRRLVLSVLVLAAIGAGSWYGHEWWTNGRFMISTDDAYIAGDIANIAPKVTGYVTRVDVVANQQVKKGDVLVNLDDGDYRIAAEQAEAQIATQQIALKRFDAQILAARASVAQAESSKAALEATLRGTEITLSRQQELATKKAGVGAELDNAKIAYELAKANLAGADSAILTAQANISVVSAQKAEAESQIRSLELTREKAERDLSFTVLKAPYDGVIGNLAVQEGDLVSPGQRLAALVPVEQLYIDANFKETQVAGIKPGAKVKIHVDAIEDHVIEGTVESISPASGAVFSLLPPENATGNFTKVIQRLPVRIAIPKAALDTGNLRAGLSVVVDIDSRTGDASATHIAQAK